MDKKAYLVRRQTTLTNSDNEGATYYAGDVLSDWELTDHIKEKLSDGVTWYTQTFEPLSEREAELYRKKATATEGKRTGPGGHALDPPWDDFIGLHPTDVVKRMKELSSNDVEKVREYERAGLNRASIIDYVAPSEREPWHDYDNWGIRDITDKMEILDTSTVQDVIVYELNHKRRPAILEFEVEEAEPDIETSLQSTSSGSGENGDDGEPEMAGVGATSTDAGGQTVE